MPTSNHSAGFESDVLDSSPVCLVSYTWHQFSVYVALAYYVIAVLSMVFTKEARRLRELSFLHDNLIIYFLFPSILESLVLTSSSFSGGFVIRLSASQSNNQVTNRPCLLVLYLHSSLQVSCVVAVAYAVYAEKIILPKTLTMAPKPICSVYVFFLQFLIGLSVTLVTALIDGAHVTNPCCLHPVNPSVVVQLRVLAFDVASICVGFILMRVSIDRFLKLIITARRVRLGTIYSHLSSL